MDLGHRRPSCFASIMLLASEPYTIHCSEHSAVIRSSCHLSASACILTCEIALSHLGRWMSHCCASHQRCC
uniref:Uncharacterized protein n=1 Tax=Arundo donax TaxID=35708 RepID=A0A0A8XQ51_ARUDO